MGIVRILIAGLAFGLLTAGPVGAATYFSGSATKVADNLYEGPGGEIISTVSCAQAASATPSLVRIDANTGAVIGRITFGGGPGCDIGAIYAPYLDAPAGTYSTVLTQFDDRGYYADTTVEPFWIVRGAPACPAATATAAFVTLAATGPTYVPPGTDLGSIAFNPGANQANCDLVAIFSKVDLTTISSFALSVTRIGGGIGSVHDDLGVIACGTTCSADFGAGTALTLTATPSPGSVFAGWSGACSGSGTGPCQVTVESAADVTATFLVEMPSNFSLSVSKAGDGGGSVASDLAGISCGAVCSANFIAHATVQLTATASPGSSFASWGGACSGTNPGNCPVTMDAAKTVTATFNIVTPVSYPLTVTKVGMGAGSITSTPAGIACGATCEATFNANQVVALAAAADPGSVFSGWSGAGCSGTGACNVTMDAAKGVTAAFTNAAPTLFRLTVNRTGNGSGGVTSSPAGIDCGATCRAHYGARTVATLTAMPQAGSMFTGWSGGGCSGTGACSVTMSSAQSVTATFSIQTFALTVTKSGAGTVTSTPAGVACGATCNGNFNSGVSMALAAVPSAGSFFNGWTGACSGTSACNVTMDAAKGVGAEFKLNTSIPRLANISTRMQVLAGNDVLIGGFIIGGSASKTVVIRARGPSLIPFGIPNALADPTMQLFSGQTILATSNDWGTASNAADITASGFAPSNPLESAILTTLGPGAYTAVVSGANGVTGVGIIEVFEVDKPEIPLLNISTRGQVLTGGDVMIGGFIIQGDTPQTVVVRARGPSLVPFGITNALLDPVLQLFNGSTLVATNDDWQAQAVPGDLAAIQNSGFAPVDAREAVIRITLPPGAYTAVVTGAHGGTGVGIVEVFAL